MKYLIAIIIVAIVIFGIYRTKKTDNGTDGASGGASGNENPVHGNEPVEPRPDDEDHANNDHE